jgi:hypothetical membrane protein
MSLRRLCLYAGIVSPVLWLGLILFGGALRPGFSHVTQFISELGERGSSTEVLIRTVAFGVTGFLYLCFAGALPRMFGGALLAVCAAFLLALEGVGRIGAGVFPCDPGCVRISVTQDLHKWFATVGFLSGVLAAITWGLVFRRVPVFRSFSWPSIAAGAAALVSLLLMSWDGNPLGAHGLFEHVASAILSVWVFVFATRLTRADNRRVA